MPRIIAPATPEFAGYTGVHPTNKGGFGASTEAGIIANIGGINKNDTSTGGIVQIGADGVAAGMEEVTVIADFTTIFGPEYFNYTSATKYEITSYTPFKTYNAYIKELPDTDVIIQDEFIFVPKGIELDIVTLVVNGREIQINRIPSGISKPNVTIVGFRDAAKDYLKVTAEGYSSEYSVTLQSVHVQVSTTSDFSAIVVDKTVSGTDAVGGIDIELTKSTSYYVRTRFLDSSGRWSEWTVSPGVTAAGLPNNIATPIVSSEGYTSETRVGFDIKSTAGFSKPGVTHASTSWQISTNVGFTALVVNNANNTVNKVSYSTEIENSSEVFYIRARHTNSASQTSSWSNVVVINRSDLFDKFSFILDQIQIGENASLAPGGTARWIDNDTFVSNNNISAVGRDNIGRILVNKRIDGKWKCVQVIEEPLHPDGPSTRTGNFGGCNELSTNKRWFCASITKYSDANHKGAVAIYENVGGTLVFNSIVRYPFSTTTDFSNGIYISDDGNELLIGAPKHTVNGFLDAGAIIHCKKVNGTWTFNILDIGTPYTSRGLGYRIHLSADGTKIFAGSYNWANTANNVTHYILKRSGDTFVIDSEIISPTPATHRVSSTGWAYAMDPSMNVVILSTRVRYDSNNVSMSGYIDIFERVNNTYTLKQRIFNNFSGTSILGQRIQGDRDLTYFIATVNSATTNDYGFIFSKVDGQWTAVSRLTIEGIESIFGDTTLRAGSLLLRSDGKEVIIGGTPAPVGYGSNISYKRQTEKYQRKSSFKPDSATAVDYERYGQGVLVSDDGNRVVVQVQNGSAGGPSACGYLDIYRKEGNFWILEQRLTEAVPVAGDIFGGSVAADAGFTRLAVSVPGNDEISYNYGVIRVFVRAGNVWSLETSVRPTDAGSSPNISTGLGMSKDGNYLFLGCVYAEDTGMAMNTGILYVYKRSGSTWNQTAKIPGPVNIANRNFGYNVNSNQDGSRIIITALPTTETADNKYTVYVYSRVGETWSVETEFATSEIGNWFGYHSCMNDAGTMIAIGAHKENSYSGAVYIYTRTGTTWTLATKLTPPNNVKNISHDFGVNVRFSGDGNFLLVGAPAYRVYGEVKGGAFLYKINGTVFALVKTFTDYTLPLNSSYGRYVGISNNSNTIAISAYFADYFNKLRVGSVNILT